jgi:hypothetical protein
LTPIVEKIAAALGETDKVPLKTIDRLVTVLGEERALALLEEALKVEAEGGLKTDDGQRQRSPGGVYFKLAKDKTTARERGRIFGPPPKPKAKKTLQPVTWEDLEPLLAELTTARKGVLTKVKLTLIGKPGKIIEKANVVLTSMQSKKLPTLPKGLPDPPEEPPTYLVFIAKKQWEKVKDSITNNPDDKLIIEGYPVFDKRIGKSGAMTLYAQMVTTTAIQQARREPVKEPR